MRVRPMCGDDLDEVIRIEQAVHEAPWTSGNFADALKAGYDAWVFEPDDPGEEDRTEIGGNAQGQDLPVRSGLGATRMIGYAIVMWLPDEVHLLNLAVAASCQGRGRGRAMLHWLLRNAQTRGAGAMMLEVRPSNRRAAALYRSAGFAQIGRRRDYYPARNGREDALVLRKHLGSS